MRLRPYKGKRYAIWRFIQKYPEFKPRQVAMILGCTAREVSCVKEYWSKRGKNETGTQAAQVD